MFSTVAKQEKKPLDTSNVSVACYLNSALLKKWQREALRVGDPKKVSRLGRAALRHFLFDLSEEEREKMMENELIESAKDKVAAGRFIQQTSTAAPSSPHSAGSGGTTGDVAWSEVREKGQGKSPKQVPPKTGTGG